MNSSDRRRMAEPDTRPGRSDLAFAWTVGIFATLLMIGWKSGSLWSDTVDLAHHFTLVERLSETGGWFSRIELSDGGRDLSLGEMADYPRAAHALAAIAGRVFGSSLIGMQVVALLAFIGTWAGLAAALGTLPRRPAFLAIAAIAILLIANGAGPHLPVHGGEIAGSYFFAQLAAQCIEIWALVLLIALSRRECHPRFVAGMAIAAMPVVACFHLLPAIELLAFAGCWLAFDLLAAGHDRASPDRSGLDRAGLDRFGRLRGLAVAAAIMTAGVALFVLHPSFAAMREISKNNGSLDIGFVNDPVALAALAIATGLASMMVLIAWRQRLAAADHAAVKLLALHGIAVALVTLAQLVAWSLGFGSEYATRKYGYGLFSALLIDAGLIAALAPWPSWKRLRAVPRLGPLLLPAVALLTIPPASETMKLAPLVALAEQVKLLRETRLAGKDGRYDVVVGVNGVSSQIAYLLSVGILRMPRDAADAAVAQSIAILEHNQVGDLAPVGTIVTSAGNRPYDIPACREFVTASKLVLIDAACAADAFGRRDICADRISFAAGTSLYPLRVSGFSLAEPTGRWTDGPTAAFRCTWPDPGARIPTRVSLEMTAFLAPAQGLSGQRVAISIDGGGTAEHVFRVGEDRHTLEIPLGQNPGPDLTIRFSLPDAVSPNALGLSRDIRRLGVYVHGVTFE